MLVNQILRDKCKNYIFSEIQKYIIVFVSGSNRCKSTARPKIGQAPEEVHEQ